MSAWPQLLVAVLVAPAAVLLVRRLFTWIDESAEYERELRDLQALGLREVDDHSVRWWVWRLRTRPSAVAEYRRRHR
ncbi:MAG TPA: hypothetical protein VNU66_04200 [Mycobacteriales bacterium]|nr:hypothetical protein [Mycobacteriales bacterium]